MRRKTMLLLSVIALLLTSAFGLGACDQSTLLNCGGNGNEAVGENLNENPNENPNNGEGEGGAPVLRELEYRLSADGTSYTVIGMGSYVSSELVIPDIYNLLPVTEIGKEAFYRCQNLTSVVIPDSVTTIGERAFAVCQKLTSVEIGSSVTSVGKYAFIDCDALISVYASDMESWCNIEFTDGYANPLEYAKSLYINNELVTEVVIPNTVTKIPLSAFSCDCVTSVVIPNTVTEIGADAFQDCTKLERVEITDIQSWCMISFGNAYANPLSFTKALYVNNELLTELVVPSTITEIKNYAFYQCESLTSVRIPDSVASIGNRAFYRCNRLTDLVIPDSVTSVGERAFYWCNKLTSAVIGKCVTEIGIMAFRHCLSLVEVVNKSPSITVKQGAISNGHVGNYALAVYNSSDEFISKLSKDKGYIIYTDGEERILIGYNGTETNLVFPDYVTKIHKYAFAYGGSLTSVVIGSSVTSIGDYAFGNCYQLVEVVNKSPFLTITKGSKENGFVGAYALALYDDDDKFTSKVSIDNGYVIYTDGEEKILIGYEGRERNLILPAYLTKINRYALFSSDLITSVVIGDSVTEIGSNAFEYCEALTSVVIPHSVTSIGFNAFENCTSLTTAVIGGGMIGFDAFKNCTNLKSVVIGSSVTIIESYAFENCTKLNSVTFEQLNNWKIFSNKNATSGSGVSYAVLAKPSTAAKYLTSTYYDHYWRRIDD